MTTRDAAARPRRRPRLGRRLLGVVVLVALLEVALQLAAPLAQRALLRRGEAALAAGAPLAVLCVGDSNTFGLNVPRAWAYPARLDALLEERLAAPVSVTNRGVPGRNAAQLARDLPRDLADTRPDVVLLLVGVNDTWNTSAESEGLAALPGRLKLVRLARVLAAGVTTAQPFEVASDERGEFAVRRGDHVERVNLGGGSVAVRSGPELAASLHRWIGRAVRTCREHLARPILLTYPESAGRHGEVNALLRQVAAELDVPLVDLERRFIEHFAREGYAALMFNDHHPNVRGYELLAADVLAALEQLGLLGDSAVQPATSGSRGPPDGAAGAPRVELAPALRAVGAGRLALSGPPGWAFQVAVAGASPDGAAAGFDAGGVRVPLAQDAVLALSRMQPELSGWLDEAGRADVEVSPVLRQAAEGRPLEACLLLLRTGPGATGDADGPIAAASAPVTVAF